MTGIMTAQVVGVGEPQGQAQILLMRLPEEMAALVQLILLVVVQLLTQVVEAARQSVEPLVIQVMLKAEQAARVVGGLEHLPTPTLAGLRVLMGRPTQAAEAAEAARMALRLELVIQEPAARAL